MRRLFIFGLGYTAQVLARTALEQGWQVAGTCRTQEKCATLRMQDIETYLFNQVPPAALAHSTHVLSSVPPHAIPKSFQDSELNRSRDGAKRVGWEENPPFFASEEYASCDPVLALYGDRLAAMKQRAWLGYLSTTGIYGDHAGAWVDEATPASPGNARLQRRMDAETQWRALGGHVFRLAGIYGPGRNALEDVLAGEARRIDKPGQVFSRAHVEDIAQTLMASMARPEPGRVYNVCDNAPSTAHEVVAYACELLGKPLPPLVPFAQAELSPMAREFYAACRRVSNARITGELGVRLRYPDYRAGLKALVSALD